MAAIGQTNLQNLQGLQNLRNTQTDLGQTAALNDVSIIPQNGQAIGDNFQLNGSSASQKAQALQQEIQALQAKKEDNLVQIGKLERKIEELTEKAQKKAEEAAQAKEDALKEHEETCSQVIKEQLQAYADANKSGSGMTKAELKQNIQNAFPDKPDFGKALAAIAASEDIAGQIKSCASDIRKYVSDNAEIDTQIAEKTKEYNEALSAASSSSSEGSDGCSDNDTSSSESECDPIGFNYNGENWEFIKDDGNFDAISDFLGSESQWDEMIALNKNGDNKVDLSEFAAGGIKMVNDKGEVIDAAKMAEMFGEDFSIDLSSYNQNGTYSNIDTNDHDNDGIANQRLLGTFNANINGQSIKGHNTMDDAEYLSSKYGITSGRADAAQSVSPSMPADENEALGKAGEAENKASQINSQVSSVQNSLGSAETSASQKASARAQQAVSSAQDYENGENGSKTSVMKRFFSFFDRVNASNNEDDFQARKKPFDIAG